MYKKSKHYIKFSKPNASPTYQCYEEMTCKGSEKKKINFTIAS